MSADLNATVHNGSNHAQNAAHHAEALPPNSTTHEQDTSENDDEDDDEEDDEDEEEPKLKYTKLTGSLTNVYRNGDSTSAFTVAGDKMVLGTHSGNIHVLALPGLKSLKTYHAHSATITSLSVSPTPPPPKSGGATESIAEPTFKSPAAGLRTQTNTSTTSPRAPQSRTSQLQSVIPNTANNAIHIATSSLDGHVCISSLLDPKDVQLRNFARPVQAVALSPDYKNDRTFLSGGLAGQLILTVGGKAGVTVDANTNSASAAATGWLGSIGFAADRGKDTVLHSGEGVIREVKWSLSAKWVVWVNEEGIKIMRSHLRLGSEESEDAWRRIAHAARPNRKGWEEMRGVWRGRCEWVDDRKIEVDDPPRSDGHGGLANGTSTTTTPHKKPARVEKLVVGWGDTAWILHVHEDRSTNTYGKRVLGSADIVHKLSFPDCIISGITLYTPSLLAILAYRTRDDDDKPIPQHDTPKKGRSHRQTGLAPQLRLIDVQSGVEADLDELSISRFESLSAQDYHLGTLYIPPPLPSKVTTMEQQKGALEGIWDAAGGKYASRVFSSSASVLSRSSDGNKTGTGSLTSPPASALGVAASPARRRPVDAHPYASEPGLKLFIQSPYDCVLAIKRDLTDQLEWKLERKDYKDAWELVNAHPEVVAETSVTDKMSAELGSQPGTPSRGGQQQSSLADFFADSASQSTHPNAQQYSLAEKEKRRIGDLWLQQLVSSSHWTEAGRVAGKVLGTSSRWEHWVFTFAHAEKFDEITPFVPKAADAQLPAVVYEVVLGHYVHTDPGKVKELLQDWEPGLELYDVGSVARAIEARLDGGRDEEDVVEEGGEDWKVLTECLARLCLADGRAREALGCWIRVQNADEAFRLIKEEKLMDVVGAEDVSGLLMLRVSKQMMKSATLPELEDASSEAMLLLVEEAHRGTVMPRTVIRQLEKKGHALRPFIFFYLRALWNGLPRTESQSRLAFDRRTEEGHALVEDHADLAVELFATYDRDLLMVFLRASSVYSYEKAAALCENRHFTPELVYVLSKTGQTKRALFLIIGELGDVKQAIAFAKENPDLWDDLLDYSMDKPSFIRGLLEEVGTAIDPIQLVRRIPEGLEIEGLRDGVRKMMREYDVQASISEGVARVLRGEVAMGMDTLRAGQKKAVRFEVLRAGGEEVELKVQDVPTRVAEGEEVLPVAKSTAVKVEAKSRGLEPGHCVGCTEVFSEEDREPLVGFACGHVYHLSCLLRANPETADDKIIGDLLGQLGFGEDATGDEDDGGGGNVRSVGAKVAHAHVIKNLVRGGCRCCSVPDGA